MKRIKREPVENETNKAGTYVEDRCVPLSKAILRTVLGPRRRIKREVIENETNKAVTYVEDRCVPVRESVRESVWNLTYQLRASFGSQFESQFGSPDALRGSVMQTVRLWNGS